MRWMRRLGFILLLAVLAAACGGSDSKDGAAAQEQTTTTAAATPATVKVATSDEYGELLVDSAGRTLYLFEKDQGTTTACTGGCVDNWPPLVAAKPVAGDGVNQAELSTAQGIKPDQVVYNGHLLYHFAGDKAAGDVNGAGIPSWYPVSPAGAAIDKD